MTQQPTGLNEIEAMAQRISENTNVLVSITRLQANLVEFEANEILKLAVAVCDTNNLPNTARSIEYAIDVLLSVVKVLRTFVA